ncbi:hypothetical protein FM106_17555 [Brachybacterium faecium]|nr:hypothetical protein FM106_17555 [Brachybacterium faecium]
MLGATMRRRLVGHADTVGHGGGQCLPASRNGTIRSQCPAATPHGHALARTAHPCGPWSPPGGRHRRLAATTSSSLDGARSPHRACPVARRQRPPLRAAVHRVPRGVPSPGRHRRRPSPVPPLAAQLPGGSS